MQIKADWSGELLDDDGKSSEDALGTLEIPDIDQETVEDGDFEIRVSAPSGKAGTTFKDSLRKGEAGKQLRALLSLFWSELQAR